jgi:hypothetical protein
MGLIKATAAPTTTAKFPLLREPRQRQVHSVGFCLPDPADTRKSDSRGTGPRSLPHIRRGISSSEPLRRPNSTLSANASCCASRVAIPAPCAPRGSPARRPRCAPGSARAAARSSTAPVKGAARCGRGRTGGNLGKAFACSARPTAERCGYGRPGSRALSGQH